MCAVHVWWVGVWVCGYVGMWVCVSDMIGFLKHVIIYVFASPDS